MTLLVGSIFHMTRKIVSEMTYNVSMGTLNPTILYYYCDILEVEWFWEFERSEVKTTVTLRVRVNDYHHCHCPSLLLFSTLNSKDTFSLNPSRHRPHRFHRTAFMDKNLPNGFLFSFSIRPNLLVWFVQ